MEGVGEVSSEEGAPEKEYSRLQNTVQDWEQGPQDVAYLVNVPSGERGVRGYGERVSSGS